MDTFLRSMARMSTVLPVVAARAVSSTLGDREHGLRELANKLRAFEAFRNAPAVPPERSADAVRDLDPWDALWVKEGIGFRSAAAAAGESAAAIGRARELPEDWWLPLHTGLGLLLAMQSLDGLPWRPSNGEVDACLDGFAARAAAAAQDRWRTAVLEALGLVARTLHPDRVGDLDRELAARPELRPAFWHGWGRGSYFSPTSAVPFLAGSAARRLAEVAAAAPDREAREQAVSGWAWALTLVNLRHPEVVASALREGEGGPAGAPELADGVASALVVWLTSGGDRERVDRFLAHALEGAAAGPWRGIVAAGRRAAGRQVPSAGDLGELFVYRPGRWPAERAVA